MLDLPGDDEYLPTYWPGQKITGEVKIQLQNNLPIKVTHLRIALFGNAQVYGDQPGKPMTNGLFDYQKNEQLINTGLRIVRRSTQQQAPTTHSSVIGDTTRVVLPSTSSTNEQQQQQQQNDDDNNSTTAGVDERRWKLCCRRDVINGAEVGPLDLQQSSNNKKKSRKNQKTPEDRHIERLIRRVAALHHISNVCDGLLYDPNPPSSSNHHHQTEETFELNANNSSTTNAIAFSIRVPTSTRLVGSFEHPHCPITYRIVAIMKCKDNDNNDITCYSTVRLRLETFMDIHAPQFMSPIQTNPTRHYVQNNSSLFTSAFTFVLSSSSILTYWLQKATQQRKIAPESSSTTSPYLSFLQSNLELPKQVFERSQYIPLQLIFENHASSHFKISAIQIHVEFVRRIKMTCSMNEEVEGKVIKSATLLFKSSEEEVDAQQNDIVFFTHANMSFDLSKLIQIPDDCTCIIFSEATRDIFSLNYDLHVQLDVTGVTRWTNDTNLISMAARQEGERSEPYYYYASDKHLVQQEQQQQRIPKESHHQSKTYTLHLDPINVVIGNSSYQQNHT